jgi:hypothetical protein
VVDIEALEDVLHLEKAGLFFDCEVTCCIGSPDGCCEVASPLLKSRPVEALRLLEGRYNFFERTSALDPAAS